MRASVPFGWIKRKDRWRAGKISFADILNEVAAELQLEYKRWQTAKRKEGLTKDFIWWLAWKGYNANPKEAADWEYNVRHILNRLP